MLSIALVSSPLSDVVCVSIRTFEAKVIEWLKAESFAIQSIKKPSTDPVALVSGPNDIDMCKGGMAGTGACVGGLTGVHLKFNASLIGTSGILSLDTITVEAADPDGAIVRHDREVIDHGDAAVVLVVDKVRDLAILVRQWRAGLVERMES